MLQYKLAVFFLHRSLILQQVICHKMVEYVCDDYKTSSQALLSMRKITVTQLAR